MEIETICSNCGDIIKAQDSMIGLTMDCPMCGNTFEIQPRRKKHYNNPAIPTKTKNNNGIFGIGLGGVLVVLLVLGSISNCVEGYRSSKQQIDFNWRTDSNINISRFLVKEKIKGKAIYEWREYDYYYEVRYKANPEDAWKYIKAYK